MVPLLISAQRPVQTKQWQINAKNDQDALPKFSMGSRDLDFRPCTGPFFLFGLEPPLASILLQQRAETLVEDSSQKLEARKWQIAADFLLW